MNSWRRILLKLSGEMLAPAEGRGLCSTAIDRVVKEIVQASARKVQVAIVVGAGNLARGAGPNRHALEISPQHLDSMGMLATAINCTALKDRLEAGGLPAVHMSALGSLPFTRPLDSQVARELLESGTVVLFSGGTGMPFFSTDTAAMVRALQIEADVLCKGTQVDGVYSSDPRGPDGHLARHLPHLTFVEALSRQLRFMDTPALALGAQHDIKVVVYNAHEEGSLAKVLQGQLTCSTVGRE
jgi:uridylate kinase